MSFIKAKLSSDRGSPEAEFMVNKDSIEMLMHIPTVKVWKLVLKNEQEFFLTEDSGWIIHNTINDNR